MKNHEIVHIAKIVLNLECFFNEMVQFIQIDVRPELRRQAADRQASIGFRTVDDYVDQCEGVRTGDPLPDDLFQYFVIDRREELRHVRFKAINPAPATTGVPEEAGCTKNTGEDALATAAGITVADHRSLEDGFDQIAERMVDDAVHEGQGRDQPLFRLVDCEKLISAWPVGLPDEAILDVDQVIFQPGGKPQDFPLIAFVAARLEVGQVKVAEFEDLRIQIVIGFHAAPGRMRPVRFLLRARTLFYFPPCGEDHDSKALCTAPEIIVSAVWRGIFCFAARNPML